MTEDNEVCDKQANELCEETVLVPTHRPLSSWRVKTVSVNYIENETLEKQFSEVFFCPDSLKNLDDTGLQHMKSEFHEEIGDLKQGRLKKRWNGITALAPAQMQCGSVGA